MLGLICLIAGATHAESARPTYRITATLSRTPPQLRGTVETTVVNTTAQPLRNIVVLLFPNRFATADEAINDANRPYVYPREEFEPGWMTVDEVLVDGQPVSARRTAGVGACYCDHGAPASRFATAPHSDPTGSGRAGPTVRGPASPDGCVLTLELSTPIQPGEQRGLHMQFTTTVPNRFGTFGEFDAMLTAIGGWYPYVAALSDDGAWATEALPALSDFAVQLAVDPELEVLLSGQYFPRSAVPITATVRAVHYLTLIAAPALLRDTIAVDGMRIVLFHRPLVRTDRRAPGPSQLEITSMPCATSSSNAPPRFPYVPNWSSSRHPCAST